MPFSPASLSPALLHALPEEPSLELLKKRAKALLRAANDGEEAAIGRLQAATPRLAKLSGSELRDAPRLADAQHAIAREHGQASWPKLVRAVEELLPLSAKIERFLEAVRERRHASAVRLLARYPEISRGSVFAAAACGEADLLAELLTARPELATVRHPGDECTPLLYAAGSTLHRSSPARGRGILRVAELLLEHGASANEFMLVDKADPETRIPALYFTCVSDHVAMVALLLERGAEPNDGESVYHAAELDHRACLELLVAHGADVSSRHPHWNNTPLYFLAGYRGWHEKAAKAVAGMRWLLEHGADPNVTSYAEQAVPLHRLAEHGYGIETVVLFLEHGAAVDPVRADGRTPAVLALRSGNGAVVELLRERGADLGRATPVDELLGACMTADAARARELSREYPNLIAALTAEDRHVFAQAAEEGREASVRLMRDLGFDLAWQGVWGGTPLHHAVWHGWVGMTRLLLGFGAAVNVRDTQFGSSPIGWAAHGSTNCRKADDDYCAIVEALLDAGAEREESINRWGEPPENMASRRVKRLLEARGFAPKTQVARRAH